jgi:hypothetical protein
MTNRDNRAINPSRHDTDTNSVHHIWATIHELKVHFVGIDWRRLAFFLGVPLVLAIYPALNNLHLLETAGRPLAISFFLAHSLPPWWITCLATQITMILLSPFRPRPIILMIIGSTAAGFLVLPYLQWVYTILPNEISFPRHTELFSPLNRQFWGYLVEAMLVWIAVNLIFDRLLGLPRYRYSSPEPAVVQTGKEAITDTINAPPTAPGFLDRLPQPVELDQLVALKAEEHYIRVYTDEQKFLIYYRFSDALDQIDPGIGLQVHRSYWINKNAIREVRKSGKKIFLELSTGLIVPVSRPYQAMVMAVAKSLKIPVDTIG